MTPADKEVDLLKIFCLWAAGWMEVIDRGNDVVCLGKVLISKSQSPSLSYRVTDCGSGTIPRDRGTMPKLLCAIVSL